MSGLLKDLPRDWRVIPFGDVVLDSAFGPRFSGDLYAENGNVATLRTTDMDNEGSICYETMPLAKLDTAKFQKHFLRKDDLVITRSGTCGIAGIFRCFDKPVLPGAFLIRLRLSGETDVRFFRYFFNSKPGRAHLLSIAAGAVQQNINITNLEKLPVPLPPLLAQRRIAEILSAFDDLIENNLRRIRILEEMARSIYREWFVNFRFPGHENVGLVDSPLGPIPERWEVKTLSDLVVTQYGYTESTNPEPVGPRYLRGMDLNKNSYIDWSQVPYCTITSQDHDNYRLHKGDIVVIRMADPGKVGIVEQEVDAVFASYLIRVSYNSDRLQPYFLFHLLDSPPYQAFIHGAATGTTRKSASAGVLTNFPFVLPPKDLVTKFEEVAASLRSLLTLLLTQIAVLRRTRDILLPRLLTGSIDAVATSSQGGEVEAADELVAETKERSENISATTKDSHSSERTLPLATGVERSSESSAQEHPGNQLELGYKLPTPIDQTDRSDVLAVIRQVFSDGQPRNRADAIREVAQALGYGRVGHRMNDVLHTDLLTAVRRGILDNVEDELILLARSIAHYDRDLLKRQFLAAVGRSWIKSDDAVENFRRWMGFRRTGPVIDETVRSVIQGLLRESRLEADGPNLISPKFLI
jgi:type I restriction enzyme S subunit